MRLGFFFVSLNVLIPLQGLKASIWLKVRAINNKTQTNSQQSKPAFLQDNQNTSWWQYQQNRGDERQVMGTRHSKEKRTREGCCCCKKKPLKMRAKECERYGQKKKGWWKEIGMKDKKRWEKRHWGNLKETRNHIPLLQHKSPEEPDHGTSCRTGLLIKHSNRHTHTHKIGPLPPCAQSVQTVWLTEKTEGIPMSEATGRPLCTCKVFMHGLQQPATRPTTKHNWQRTSLTCNFFLYLLATLFRKCMQEVVLKINPVWCCRSSSTSRLKVRNNAQCHSHKNAKIYYFAHVKANYICFITQNKHN